MQKQKIGLFDFEMLCVLGVGNYAKILLVRLKSNKKVYAMKIIKKELPKKQKQEKYRVNKNHAFIEREILAKFQHPFIIKMYTTFQHAHKLYYILEYCQGGQLFGCIKRMKKIKENMAKFYAAQLLLVIQYLHSHHIIYRDLKPENVLIDRKGYLKLIDFGLSCFECGAKKGEFVGTPEYLAPQSFQNKISYEVDWWAYGSLIFEMICGFPPFFQSQASFQLMYHKIMKQEPPLDLIKNLDLKDFIRKLLYKNPKERLGSLGDGEQIRKHQWLKGISWEKLIKKSIPAPFIPKFQSEIDTKWFELQSEDQHMTPPEEEDLHEYTSETYQSFSLSWKSSQRQCSWEQNASPIQFTLDIKSNPTI